MPVLREHFPKEVSDRIVDVLKLDVRASERTVLEATVAALRKKGRGKRSRARRGDDWRLSRQWPRLRRARGHEARAGDGQVDELVITAVPAALASSKDTAAANGSRDVSAGETTADDLIVQARNTSAKVPLHRGTRRCWSRSAASARSSGSSSEHAEQPTRRRKR
jgi:hypothetical protein